MSEVVENRQFTGRVQLEELSRRFAPL
jgi:hypothetical protein